MGLIAYWSQKRDSYQLLFLLTQESRRTYCRTQTGLHCEWLSALPSASNALSVGGLLMKASSARLSSLLCFVSFPLVVAVFIFVIVCLFIYSFIYLFVYLFLYLVLSCFVRFSNF